MRKIIIHPESLVRLHTFVDTQMGHEVTCFRGFLTVLLICQMCHEQLSGPIPIQFRYRRCENTLKGIVDPLIFCETLVLTACIEHHLNTCRQSNYWSALFNGQEIGGITVASKNMIAQLTKLQISIPLQG